MIIIRDWLEIAKEIFPINNNARHNFTINPKTNKTEFTIFKENRWYSIFFEKDESEKVFTKDEIRNELLTLKKRIEEKENNVWIHNK